MSVVAVSLKKKRKEKEVRKEEVEKRRGSGVVGTAEQRGSG